MAGRQSPVISTPNLLNNSVSSSSSTSNSFSVDHYNDNLQYSEDVNKFRIARRLFSAANSASSYKVVLQTLPRDLNELYVPVSYVKRLLSENFSYEEYEKRRKKLLSSRAFGYFKSNSTHEKDFNGNNFNTSYADTAQVWKDTGRDVFEIDHKIVNGAVGPEAVIG
jgi:hypothetical protein